MKKLKNLTFACLLILGLAACAGDDKSSSNNPPITDNSKTITIKLTGKIGEETVNTITFTNPHAVEADLDATIHQYTMEDSVVFDADNSTCDEFVNLYGNYEVRSKLAAGASCEIKYTYKPTELNTKLLWIDVDYIQSFKTVCPTPDTVPTVEKLMNAKKYVQMRVFNYAVNSNNEESPNIINVDMGTAPYNLDDKILTDLELQTFQIPFAKDDVYQINGSYSYHLESDGVNCTIEGNTLTALTNEACTITVKKNTEGTLYNGSQLIIFSPKDNTKPSYNVLMEVNSDISYEKIVDSFTPSYIINDSSIPSYIIDYLMEDKELYVGILENGVSISKYTISGPDKAKFKVVPTKDNGCNVTANTITIPASQTSCYYTVELDDKSQKGDFTAILDIGTYQYNINGIVDSINSRLANACKSENK